MDRHEWTDPIFGGPCAVEGDRDTFRYETEHQGQSLNGRESLFVREILRLAGRVKELEGEINLGKLVPETRMELATLADVAGLTVTAHTTAADVAQAAAATIKELRAIERHRDELQGALDSARARAQTAYLERDKAVSEASGLRVRTRELEGFVRQYDAEALDRQARRAEDAERRLRAAEERLSCQQAIVDAAVKPWRDEVRGLSAQLAAADTRNGELAGKLAVAEDRIANVLARSEDGARREFALIAERDKWRAAHSEAAAVAQGGQARIDELEQENYRLRGGIERARKALGEIDYSPHVRLALDHLRDAADRLDQVSRQPEPVRAAWRQPDDNRQSAPRYIDDVGEEEPVTREKARGDEQAGPGEVGGQIGGEGLPWHPEPPPFVSGLRVQAQSLFSREDIRQAVNSVCACGGGGPGDCCPACDVWHYLNGRSLAPAKAGATDGKEG